MESQSQTRDNTTERGGSGGRRYHHRQKNNSICRGTNGKSTSRESGNKWHGGTHSHSDGPSRHENNLYDRNGNRRNEFSYRGGGRGGDRNPRSQNYRNTQNRRMPSVEGWKKGEPCERKSQLPDKCNEEVKEEAGLKDLVPSNEEEESHMLKLAIRESRKMENDRMAFLNATSGVNELNLSDTESAIDIAEEVGKIKAYDELHRPPQHSSKEIVLTPVAIPDSNANAVEQNVARDSLSCGVDKKAVTLASTQDWNKLGAKPKSTISNASVRGTIGRGNLKNTKRTGNSPTSFHNASQSLGRSLEVASPSFGANKNKDSVSEAETLCSTDSGMPSVSMESSSASQSMSHTSLSEQVSSVDQTSVTSETLISNCGHVDESILKKTNIQSITEEKTESLHDTAEVMPKREDIAPKFHDGISNVSSAVDSENQNFGTDTQDLVTDIESKLNAVYTEHGEVENEDLLEVLQHEESSVSLQDQVSCDEVKLNEQEQSVNDVYHDTVNEQQQQVQAQLPDVLQMPGISQIIYPIQSFIPFATPGYPGLVAPFTSVRPQLFQASFVPTMDGTHYIPSGFHQPLPAGDYSNAYAPRFLAAQPVHVDMPQQHVSHSVPNDVDQFYYDDGGHQQSLVVSQSPLSVDAQPFNPHNYSRGFHVNRKRSGSGYNSRRSNRNNYRGMMHPRAAVGNSRMNPIHFGLQHSGQYFYNSGAQQEYVNYFEHESGSQNRFDGDFCNGSSVQHQGHFQYYHQ